MLLKLKSFVQALRTPLIAAAFSSMIVAAYGWSVLLYGVAAMDILAAFAALLLLKPALRAHHKRYPATGPVAEMAHAH